MNFDFIIERLLKSQEPSVRYKVLINVLNKDPHSKEIIDLQSEIKKSKRVKKLLSGKQKDGKILAGNNIYSKWQGAHWIMAALADIGYPAGDKALIPVRDQLLDFWLKEYYYMEFECKGKADSYGKDGVPLINGRYRRCGSQQGSASYSILKLGLDDERVDKLAERLLHWQWDDGGWNCDKNPNAKNSSFMESLLPMRGLSLYSKVRKDKVSAVAAQRASEVFLIRKMFKSRSQNKVINKEFTCLHYPLYWHYDILGGLKGMAEAGFINDERCGEALDLLKKKMLKEGGWISQNKYYFTVSDKVSHNTEYVEWGDTGRNKVNEWVTADALYVLSKAGML